MPKNNIEIIYFNDKIESPEIYTVDTEADKETDSSKKAVNAEVENLAVNEIIAQGQTEDLPISRTTASEPPLELQYPTRAATDIKLPKTVVSEESTSNKESVKATQAAAKKDLGQVEKQQQKNANKRDAIERISQMRHRLKQRNFETPDITRTIVSRPKLNVSETPSPPFPKPSRAKDSTARIAHAGLKPYRVDDRSPKVRPIGVESGVFDPAASVNQSTTPNSKLKAENYNKNELSNGLSDKKPSHLVPPTAKKQFWEKEGDKIENVATAKKYSYAQNVKTFGQSGLPSSRDKRDLLQTRKFSQLSEMRKTPELSKQASCKRTMSVIGPSTVPFENVRPRDHLTINVLLGHPRNWNYTKQQLTISQLLGTNMHNHKTNQGSISISELLKTDSTAGYAKTTICVE